MDVLKVIKGMDFFTDFIEYDTPDAKYISDAQFKMIIPKQKNILKYSNLVVIDKRYKNDVVYKTIDIARANINHVGKIKYPTLVK